MALLTAFWVIDVILLMVVLLFSLFLFLSHQYDYFRSRGIPYLTPIPLVGHLWLFTKSQTEISRFLYNSFPNERFFGFYQSVVPTLVVKDPELIQKIMVKDFGHFYDRGFPNIAGDIILAKSLFNMRGQPWHSLRTKLTPTFSTGKMKLMFDQLLKSGDNMLHNIDQQQGEPLDAKLVAIEFGTEVIASTAFGIDFSKENPQTQEFITRVSKGLYSGFYLALLLFLATVAPNVLDRLGARMLTPGTQEYFVNLTKATKEYRKRNSIKRNDYFDLLLKLQEAEEKGDSVASPGVLDEDDALINQMEHAPKRTAQNTAESKLLTDEVMSAQTFVFLMAGSESVSGTLSFMLYHIAKDPAVQKRLIEELDNALPKHVGWTYQMVKELTFLDQVVQEALRIYPMVPFLSRECTTPYHIPKSDVVLEKGTKVFIPISGIHMDPKYYPNPEEFKPERFKDNNHKPSSTYMPFGDGPRICIAMRFAILEIKVCLAKLLSKYSVEINKKTQEPLVLDISSFVPKPVGGIWIDFRKRHRSFT